MNESRIDQVNDNQGSQYEKIKDWVLMKILSREPIYPPENDDMKAIHKEVNRYFAETQGNLNALSYSVLSDNLKYAKFYKVDVSKIEAQMPELRKKVIPNGLATSLAETQSKLLSSNYFILTVWINEAKDAGMDVSKIEAQMPELNKKVIRHELNNSLISLKEDTCIEYYKNVNIYIKQAKDAGMVVSKIEAQMPAFKKKILHQDLHEALVGQSYDFLKSAVVAAKADGIDVSRIEKEMPKLQKKMLREAAYSVFEEIKADSYPTEAGWNLLQQNIKAAKDAGVDVSRIEKEMPKLQKKIH